MNRPLLVGILIFVGVVLLIEGGFLAVLAMRRREARRVRRRLHQFAEQQRKTAMDDIVRQKVYSEVPWLNSLIRQIANARQLSLLIEQANAPYTAGFYMLLTALLGVVGAVVGLYLRMGYSLVVVLGLLGATLPTLYLLSRRSSRMSKFERQFPEALELLARAMRAGHAFTSALKMVSDEFDDPAGPEFARVIEEINFGIAVPEALTKLTTRLNSQDLKFFVVAVIVQRETGGNLAEIVEKIGSLIRARFVLQGKVRALSAERRLSALVLALLPVFLTLYFLTTQPEYIKTLARDPIGHMMIAGAVVMSVAGMVVMHRMVQIKV